MKVLFVCLGNICRSPTAHAVFRQKSDAVGLGVEIESAGTSAYHVGSKPDQRSRDVGQQRGYDFSGIFSRKVQDDDFDYYDLILAMDNENLKNLKAICPPEHQSKVRLMLEFSAQYKTYQEVPDPYYGGLAGFTLVLDMLEDASDGLITYIQQR